MAKINLTKLPKAAKILVVDDESETCKLVKSILESEGHKVEVAYNGTQCLEKAKTNSYDLITLDVMMPDLSGWDVFQRLKLGGEKAKIVFLSVVEVSMERLEMLKKSGVSDYILKPFESDDLAKRIKSVLTA